MRNLKRALSLALASVIVMGLMVAGSSAKGYDDVTSEENVEAIEVLQAVGIMTGDDNGNFNPTQNVTRNESVPMTRNDVTQLVLNGLEIGTALNAGVTEYTIKETDDVLEFGIKVPDAVIEDVGVEVVPDHWIAGLPLGEVEVRGVIACHGCFLL
ncbi:MAG: S-layer homology domain-containing protein [Lawsonibacter sp.]|nr:S-layer homology domain-containing protein [Lawsonibacter sp.]